jgi:F-type H+-transporting ATPase subunit delta
MSANTEHSSPLSVSYARSLLELANERHQAREIGQELEHLRDVMSRDPDFKEFLANPGISSVQRGEAIERVFSGRASELFYNFLRVANEKGRLGMLDQIASAYDQLLDEQLGNVEVDVTSAQPLNAEQVAQIGRRISDALGKTAIVHQTVDDSIIGGLVVKVGDRVLDASVRQQLNAMRQQLLSGAQRASASGSI